MRLALPVEAGGTTCGGGLYLLGLGGPTFGGWVGTFVGARWALPVGVPGWPLPLGTGTTCEGWAGIYLWVGRYGGQLLPHLTGTLKTQNCFQNTYHRKRPLLQTCITCEPLPFLRANFVVQNCDFPTCLVYSGRQTRVRGNMTGASPRMQWEGRFNQSRSQVSRVVAAQDVPHEGTDTLQGAAGLHMKAPIPYKGPRV